MIPRMTLSACETPIEDVGFSVQFPNNNKEMEAKLNGLWKQLLEVWIASSSSYSPSSFVCNRLTSSVSCSPSFAVEVSGNFLSSDRSALVKVKRSSFLAPTLKHLRMF